MFSRALLLVLLGLSCLQSSTFAQSCDGANRASICCFEFHKRPFPAANVVSYQETRADCPTPGVIFSTKRGFRFCAEPEVDWVKKIIETMMGDFIPPTVDVHLIYLSEEAMVSTRYCLLLVLLGLSCLQSSTMAENPNGASVCCFEFHKRPFPAGSIVSYQYTRDDCLIPGVIFTTKKGFRFCADPEVDWVKKIIESKPSS